MFTQSCPTLWDAHEQLFCSWDSLGKNAGWVAMSHSRGSFLLRDWSCVSCGSFVWRHILHYWATWEAVYIYNIGFIQGKETLWLLMGLVSFLMNCVGKEGASSSLHIMPAAAPRGDSGRAAAASSSDSTLLLRPLIGLLSSWSHTEPSGRARYSRPLFLLCQLLPPLWFRASNADCWERIWLSRAVGLRHAERLSQGKQAPECWAPGTPWPCR